MIFVLNTYNGWYRSRISYLDEEKHGSFGEYGTPKRSSIFVG
jgi:hypothetical protein